MKKTTRDARRKRRDPDFSPARHGENENRRNDRGEERHANRRDSRRRPRFSREVSVLYEDDAVIVLNKPPGLLAVPIKGSNTPSALSVVTAALRPRKQKAFVVHRIDRFASGILLFAKTSRDRDALIHQFLAHTPVRQYLAVVRGQLRAGAQTLVHYFRRDGMFQQLRKANDPDATRAELRCSVDRPLRDASLVRVDLVTGLQNQIRAQFSALGHPIIGDRKYHQKEAGEAMIDRVALHAAHLEFEHPRSGKVIAVDCEPPRDFQQLVRHLESSRHSR